MPTLPASLLSRLEWRLRHSVTSNLIGDYRSVFRGRGMEFDQVVKYQWGDDTRDIDWNVTARLGEPYRKRFVEERDLSILMVFEDSPALQFGSDGRTRRETLVEAAALLMLVGIANRDRVSVLHVNPVGHWYEPPRSGRGDCLRIIARLQAQPAPSLDGPPQCAIPWSLVRRVATPRSVLLWFGPFLQGPLPIAWRALQRRYQAIGVRADDAWDRELPSHLRAAAYDPLSGLATIIDTNALSTRAAHLRWRAERDRHFSNLFPGVTDRLLINTEEDPLEALVGYFHRVGRGRVS